MKLKVMLFATTSILSLSFGCSSSAPAPNSQTSNTPNSTKTTVEATRPPDNQQNVTITSGDKTLSVKQSNESTEINNGKGSSVRVKNNQEEPDVYTIDESGNVNDSTVSDGKGNRVTTKTRDGKQTSVIQSGDNKVQVKTENGKDQDSVVTDGKGNKVKMKNGQIEIQSADGKKIQVTTPH